MPKTKLSNSNEIKFGIMTEHTLKLRTFKIVATFIVSLMNNNN